MLFMYRIKDSKPSSASVDPFIFVNKCNAYIAEPSGSGGFYLAPSNL